MTRRLAVVALACLTGLAAQTLPHDRFEVVIIDDMSSEDLAPVFERGRRELGLTIRTATVIRLLSSPSGG